MKRHVRSSIAFTAAMVVGAIGFTGCAGNDSVADEGKTTSLEFTYKVAKPCIRPGEKQSITLTTEAEANVGIAITYPDGKPSTETPRGVTNKKGTYTGSWSIPADAAAGTARVTLLAAKEKKTGSEDLTFTLVPQGASC